MPGGVPVATVALDGAKNAGILAAQILGTHDKEVAKRLEKYKNGLKSSVEASAVNIEAKGWKAALKSIVSRLP
jgi:5-(carboxyamino)imidazole ribonucleotide mutase